MSFRKNLAAAIRRFGNDARYKAKFHENGLGTGNLTLTLEGLLHGVENAKIVFTEERIRDSELPVTTNTSKIVCKKLFMHPYFQNFHDAIFDFIAKYLVIHFGLHFVDPNHKHDDARCALWYWLPGEGNVSNGYTKLREACETRCIKAEKSVAMVLAFRQYGITDLIVLLFRVMYRYERQGVKRSRE